MQSSKVFYTSEANDSFSDTLFAHGLAEILTLILQRNDAARGGKAVRIIDCGGYYRLDCVTGIDDAMLERACQDAIPLFPAIRTAKNAATLEGLPNYMSIDYEEQRAIRANYLEWLKNLPPELKKQAITEGYGEDVQRPHAQWDLFRAVNPAALIGYNALALGWWQAHRGLPNVLSFILDTASQPPPHDAAEIATRWKELDRQLELGIGPEASALQLFNPTQGKGQNRGKANSLSMGNMSGFWIDELLKVAGFTHAAITRALTSGDRKSYVIAPRELEHTHLDRIMSEFSRAMVGAESSIKSDIYAVIRFTRLLLRYAAADDEQGLLRQLMGSARLRDVVFGFHTAFYKDLGNAVATMNLSSLALPDWVRISDSRDVELVTSVLDEHEAIIRPMDETHSEDIAMLQDYRDFLSAGDFREFFSFTTRYAGYIISQQERGRYVRLFTITNLGRLLMDTFSEIVQNEGFRKIAYAIRQSTVNQQYRKSRGNRPIYEIRYGLHHELSRAARDPKLFISALSGFINRYNAENAQVAETRKVQYRQNIETSAIENIVRLIDQYQSAELICNLLLAYGYARDDSAADEDDDEQAE